MARIGAIVPILPVPLVCWLIQKNGPMTRAQVEMGVSQTIQDVPHAHIHLPRDNRDYAAEVGLRQLVKHGVLLEQDGKFCANPAQTDLLHYYANSIRHLMPADDPDISASAKQYSATAGL